MSIYTLSPTDLTTAKRRYGQQKHNASRRNIPFLLTFEEWIEWWLATGHYHERGRAKDEYVMARKGDIGPYALDNIFCTTHSENFKEANKGRVMPLEQRAKIGAKARGRKLPPVPDEVRLRRAAGIKKSWETRDRTKSPETRAKISAAGRGRKLSAEHKAKISAAGKGRKDSDEVRAKKSAAQKGREVSEEARQKLREANLGKKQSPETIAKRKASIAKRYAEKAKQLADQMPTTE